MVLGLFPPVPVAFDDPHQLQSYPRLDVHFSSSRRVFTRGGQLDSAGRGAGSCHGSRCLLLCRVLVPFPGIAEHCQPEPRPLAPEVARVVCEVLAPSPPRGVPKDRSFLSDFHFAQALLLLCFCAACVTSCISPRRGNIIILLLARLLAPRREGLLQPSHCLLALLHAAHCLPVLLHPRAACACCSVSYRLQSGRHFPLACLLTCALV